MGRQRLNICKSCNQRDWFDVDDFYNNDCSECGAPVGAPENWDNASSVVSEWPGGIHRGLGMYFEPGTTKREMHRAAAQKGISLTFDGRLIPKQPNQKHELRRELRQKYNAGQYKAYMSRYGNH